MYSQHRPQDFFWGALAGGAIATLTTLFFTTKKGQELQTQVADAYEGAEESVKDFFSKSKTKMKKAAKKTKEAVEQVGDKIASQFEENEPEDHD